MDDARHIENGWTIPSEGYCDQPYVVVTDDGTWLCVMTTAAGHEGQSGQHVISVRSSNQGRTWSEPVPLEPSDGPEASYAVLLKTPFGRIYAFYNHNTDNLRWVKADNPPHKDGKCTRVDSLGYYVCRYSDDHGVTWSKDRYIVPSREMQIDRENPYGGDVRFFWNVGKAFSLNGAGYVPLIKVGRFGRGFFQRNEGALLKSDNILTERDATKLRWETLPEGDVGLRTPPGGGPIAAEQSYSVMSDGSIFVVYRTIDGHPCHAYSRDAGRTWTEPAYMPYGPGERLIRHPRAANFAWRTQSGKYLYWFHNHGGKDYEDRNPVWMCSGEEYDAPDGKRIRWSEPEVLLYDDNVMVRMSYPDLLEHDGKVYFTETQKRLGRVHEMDPAVQAALLTDRDALPALQAPLLEKLDAMGLRGSCDSPTLPAMVRRDTSSLSMEGVPTRAGLTIDLDLQLDSLTPGQIIIDSRDEQQRGWHIQVNDLGCVAVTFCDGQQYGHWHSVPGAIVAGRRHRVSIVIDGGPHIIMFIIDGRMCDGGVARQFGWGRFSEQLHLVRGSDTLRFAPRMQGRLYGCRMYDRALKTAEIVRLQGVTR